MERPGKIRMFFGIITMLGSGVAIFREIFSWFSYRAFGYVGHVGGFLYNLLEILSSILYPAFVFLVALVVFMWGFRSFRNG